MMRRALPSQAVGGGAFLASLAAYGLLPDTAGGAGANQIFRAAPCFVKGVSARATCHRIRVPEGWAAPLVLALSLRQLRDEKLFWQL